MTVYDPPVATYIPLQTITLGSAASSVTFASIPQTYRDLVLVMEASPTDTSFPSVIGLLNDDSGSNYPHVRMFGSGSSAGSAASTLAYLALGINYGLGNTTASRFILNTTIMDYSATDKHKTALSRSGTSTHGVEALAARWASNNAVTSFKVYIAVSNFAIGSTFSLYGIAS